LALYVLFGPEETTIADDVGHAFPLNPIMLRICF
jgi:hypothetical protein